MNLKNEIREAIARERNFDPEKPVKVQYVSELESSSPHETHRKTISFGDLEGAKRWMNREARWIRVERVFNAETKKAGDAKRPAPKSLRADLVRLAYENPEVREDLLPLISESVDLDEVRAAAIVATLCGSKPGQKTAFNEDTRAFVASVLVDNDPIPAARLLADAVAIWGKKAPLGKASKPKARRGDLKKGEVFNFDLDKNRKGSQRDKGYCEQFPGYDGFYAIVESVEPDGLIINIFDKNDKRRMARVATDSKGGRGSGFMRGRKQTGLVEQRQGPGGKKVEGGSFEMVYLRDGSKPPTLDQVKELREYIDKGLSRGEDRSFNYFQGKITMVAINDQDKPFMRAVVGQRQTPRTFSLAQEKGKVLYFARPNQRGNYREGLLEAAQAEVASKVDPDGDE